MVKAIYNLHPNSNVMSRVAQKRKSKDGFIRVSIPEDIAELIDKIIENSHGKYKYRSEVIRHAVVTFFELQQKKEDAQA